MKGKTKYEWLARGRSRKRTAHILCTLRERQELKFTILFRYTMPYKTNTLKSYNSNTTHSCIHPHLQARKEVQKIQPTFVVYRRKTTTEITELCYSFNAEVIQTKTGQKTLTWLTRNWPKTRRGHRRVLPHNDEEKCCGGNWTICWEGNLMDIPSYPIVNKYGSVHLLNV